MVNLITNQINNFKNNPTELSREKQAVDASQMNLTNMYN